MRWRVEGEVTEVLTEREGAQTLRERPDDGTPRPALNYPALSGPVQPGDRVLLNTVAVELGLGTGGADFVIANLSRPLPNAEPPGHILKLRYTPLQTPVLAFESPESPHHAAFQGFESLAGLPVVCVELHSQVAAACAGAKWALRRAGRGTSSVSYVMTEGAALPLALSRLVPDLKAGGFLDNTVTAGQAFGGDYEAVNLYSALAGAERLGLGDVLIVGQGPGNAGTGTPLGFSGIDQGQAVNAVGALGGVPVVAPRLSFADGRDRHRGVSHHTLTVLRRVALAPALVAVPRLPAGEQEAVLQELSAPDLLARHALVMADADAALRMLAESGLRVTTMGRGVAEERAFFLAAAAAGIVAGQIAGCRG